MTASSSRKKALVTGGATGIGRSAVLALAHAGYDVAINYASSAKAAQELAALAQQEDLHGGAQAARPS